MNDRLVFFVGGSPSFSAVADEFVPAAGGSDAHILVCMSRPGPDRKKYVPDFIFPWIERGVERFSIMGSEDLETIDAERFQRHANDATGIFFAGGSTALYQKLYCADPIADIIRSRSQEGVPIAGVSAGALILLEHCRISLEGECGEARVRMEQGIGLVKDVLVEAHFTERDLLPRLLETMRQTKTHLAYGIDDGACAVFRDGRFDHSIGSYVHRVQVTDFETKQYDVLRCDSLISKHM